MSDIEKQIPKSEDTQIIRDRGRPRKYSKEEKREKRLAAQKIIRDKRRDALIKWRTETSTAQQELLNLLKERIITDTDAIEIMFELVKMIQEK